VRSDADLAQRLASIVAAGGEGVMLRRAQALYRATRSDDLLKVKPRQDGDARVVAYVPGKGKYSGLTGALEVVTAAGVRFRVGSGLTDADRRDPPPLESWILYSHEGYTDAGVPRFARYLRTRDDVEGFEKQ
jgi:DNA ligase-1